MIRLWIAVLLCVLCGASRADHDIDGFLKRYVDVGQHGTAVAVGIVDAAGARVHAHGRTSKDGGPVDGDTLFEIGSITKVFTALLLADMAAKGEVGYHDPIAKYVPASVKSPRVHDITLLHLGRHTAGLLRNPGNLVVSDPANPWSGYSAELAFAELDAYTTRHNVGTRYSYSNYGMGLLGLLLARHAKADYETLVTRRILAPLGMADSGIARRAGARTMAQGHGADNSPVPPWDVVSLEGAGALRSTANDMNRFMQAQLGYRATALLPAIRATQEVTVDKQAPDLESGLGWLYMKVGAKRLLWHNGGTGGFRSFMGLDIAAGRGIVVLSNSWKGVENIGLHFLEPSIPLDQPVTR